MAQSPSERHDPILSGHKVWMDLARTGDLSELDSILCDDVLLMPPNETSLYGKAEVKEWFQEYFRSFRIASITETDRDVTMSNDGIAIENWTYMVAIDPLGKGDRIRDDGRFLTIWKRQPDGAWKISHTIWNSVRPIGSGTSRFLARMKK
jgi:ketosteroid isomerase-like protein